MSDRDKKLLIYLGALIILAAAYFFIGRPFLDKLDDLSNEKTQLQSELSTKREAFDNKATYEQGIIDANTRINEIIEEFPEGNSDEKSIMFLSHAEAEIPVWFPQVRFAEETKNMINGTGGEDIQSTSDIEAEAEQEAVAAAEDENNETSIGGRGEELSEVGDTTRETGISELMYSNTELGLSYETTYEGFKNMLAYIRDYKDRMIIKDIDVAYNPSTGMTTGNIVLSLYAITGPERELPAVETKVEDFGTDNVFLNSDKGGSILDLISDVFTDFLGKILGEFPEETKDELGTDYFLKVNAVTDNTNGKTIGRADDATETTYVTSDGNIDEDVYFRVSGSEGDYSVTYEIDNSEYTDEIAKSGNAKLYLRVVSSARMDEEDKSAVTIHVINNSDIPVVVNIEGDDSDTPRVRVKEKVGEVTVNGEH